MSVGEATDLVERKIARSTMPLRTSRRHSMLMSLSMSMFIYWINQLQQVKQVSNACKVWRKTHGEATKIKEW